MAPNVEQMDVNGGIDDHLVDIIAKCMEQSVPLIFALSRKRLGHIYGNRKKVSAVALLNVHGLESLHEKVVSLMMQGKARWEELTRSGQTPPPFLMLDDEVGGDEAEKE